MQQAPSTAPSNRAAPAVSRIEALLAAYPEVSADDLEDLRRWFAREASALDVAMIASNQGIGNGYRRFRAEHVDPLTLVDVARAVMFAALPLAAIGTGLWLAG